MKKMKKRYFEVSSTEKGQDEEAFEPDLTHFTSGRKSSKEKTNVQKEIDSDFDDGEKISPKVVRTKRKVDIDTDSDSGLSDDESKMRKTSTRKVNKKVKTKKTVHDLSKLNTQKFRPNKWQLKKSMKAVADRGSSQDDGSLRQKDPFPGDAPIPTEKIRKYKRGERTDLDGISNKFHSRKLDLREKKYKAAMKQSARAEFLLTEQQGYIEADEGEHTSHYTQHQIADSVDISSAQKYFELKMDKFGPYRVNYTRNGRHLLLGGSKGHVAAIDWQSKKLMCEMNVMETCSDVKWLHIETMFAVAQRQWTYIYDNQGIELHCLKGMDQVLRMEFLPYHFLLASGNAKGYLQWLDVSVGKKVAGFMTGLGRLDVMCQNPRNAIVHMGHSGGTVTLWSPNIKEPLVKMLCHGSGTRSVAVTKDGLYMATSGIDRTLKIWDLRTYKLLHGYKVAMGAGQLSFSQRGVLAAAMGNVVQMYRSPCTEPETSVYLNHRLPESVSSIQFCPYEDVLGVGHAHGFSSLLVPGAGEPNFDALEANPYQTKKQRNHAEVKMLLDKIQPDMINLDSSILGKVDKKTLQDKLEEKRKILYVKPAKIDFEPRYKKKGRSKTGKIEHRKQTVQEQHKREHIKQVLLEKEKTTQKKTDTKSDSYDVLDRFAKKAS